MRRHTAGTSEVADELEQQEVEFEVEDDDGDGEVDDDDDGEAEVEGVITGVDRSATTLTVDSDGTIITIVLTDQTEIDDDDYATFDVMANAFEGGMALWAEAEGTWETDTRLLAHDVEFEDLDVDTDDN